METQVPKLHWLCRLLGHSFKTAYDCEEGAPTISLDAQGIDKIGYVLVATGDNVARIIAASKPLKQHVVHIYCKRCGLIKGKDGTP